jgi:hypothetical protein
MRGDGFVVGVATAPMPMMGAEAFFVHDEHVVGGARDDGGFEVVAGAIEAFAAGEDTGSFGDGVGDLGFEQGELGFAGEGADVRFVVFGGADDEAFYGIDEGGVNWGSMWECRIRGVSRRCGGR